MRKTINIILVLSLLLSSISYCFAEVPSVVIITKDCQIRGAHYTDGLRRIDNENDYDAIFDVHSIEIYDNEISIDGLILDGNSEYIVKASGTPYRSVVSDSHITGLFEIFDDASIVGFSIETIPDAHLLLYPTLNNYEKRDPLGSLLSVIKVAVLVNNKDVYYFEWLIGRTIIQDVLDRGLTLQPSEELEYSLYCSERWFLPYLHKYRVKTGMSQEPEGLRTTLVTSPVYPINVNNFINVGTYTMYSNTDFGWYMTTDEYPIGSNNRMSSLLQWQYVYPSSVSKGVMQTFNFKISAAGEYNYIASEDVIVKVTDFSLYKLGSAKIGVSLRTAKGDIMTEYEFSQVYNQSTLISVFLKILGLWNRTQGIGTALSLLSSLSPQSTTSGADSFPDHISAYASPDDTVLFAGTAIPGSYKMYRVNDKLLLKTKWVKPTDAANYYTYVTGTKSVEVAFRYTVYSGNTVLASNKSMYKVYTYN